MAEVYERGKQIIIADNTVKLLEYLKLNIRQEKIIRYLVINEQIDNTLCQKICNSIKRTATRDLTGFVEKNILKKIGEKKGTYYILSPKVIEKIRDIKGHR